MNSASVYMYNRLTLVSPHTQYAATHTARHVKAVSMNGKKMVKITGKQTKVQRPRPGFKPMAKGSKAKTEYIQGFKTKTKTTADHRFVHQDESFEN